MEANRSIADNPVYQEEHYAAAKTERLHIGAILASAADGALPERPLLMVVAVVFIAAGAMRLGWLMRELSGMPYTIYHLAWLIPLVTLLVAWGNRRAAE